MRSIAHWTPRYVLASGRVLYDQMVRPEDPWLTREAIGLLERLVRPTDVVLEFGAGRSTRWLARRVAKMISVEDNEAWHQRVKAWLESDGLDNAELLHHPGDLPESEGAKSQYVSMIDDIADESLDMVLIDGIYRNHCAVASVPKVKPGGLVVIDNANWFLPSATHSPTSRRQNDGPVDAVWQEFVDISQDWRHIWTSNGVWDTLILFKR